MPKRIKDPNDIRGVEQSTEFAVENGSPKCEDFKNEQSLIDFLVLNMEVFVEQYLNDELVSFELEKPIKKRYSYGPRQKRVDLFIKGKKGCYIVETKNPSYPAENRYAIGQLLDYGREFESYQPELFLISSSYDIDTAKTIKHYNLPIRYLYFSKKVTAEYLRDA